MINWKYHYSFAYEKIESKTVMRTAYEKKQYSRIDGWFKTYGIPF